MRSFPSIDEVHKILDEIAEKIPPGFFNKLNKGIILLPEYKLHPYSKKNNKLYVMGNYSKDITGRQIKIYYGSFKKVYDGIPLNVLREKLKDTLLHEFTHHLESLAGEKGLEIKDAKALKKYLNNF
jgi:hypothetical protein